MGGVAVVVGDMDWGGERRRGVSAESEVNPLRRNITCTNECARCLSLTLQAPALVFRGLEGFLLSGGSDRLSKVHCFTHTNTRAVSVRGCVCVCVCVCAQRTLAFSLARGSRGCVFNNVF